MKPGSGEGGGVGSDVLAIAGLHVALMRRRRATLLLRDVSLRIAPGEIHALVGESGAGKSMIVRTVLGVPPGGIRVLAGAIDLLGRPWLTLAESTRREMLGRDIALIPQDPLTALNPAWRIGRQLGDLMRLHLSLRGAALAARVLQWLAVVQIRDPARVAAQYPHELSGGMRQRVLIAMAFCCEPKLILADEPTTALDVTVQREILKLLRSLQQAHRTAILFVTHNLGVVARLCDNATVLHSGMVIESASVGSLFAAPQSPYTRALIAATPRHDRPASSLVPVAEDVTRQLLATASRFDLDYAAAYGLNLDASRLAGAK